MRFLGWRKIGKANVHGAKELKVPANMTLPHSPPYSPERNPITRVWAFLRSHYLSNRVFTRSPTACSDRV